MKTEGWPRKLSALFEQAKLVFLCLAIDFASLELHI